ncbi:hypothetical protein, partial [Frankia sp. AiPa1]|uniref:hypothetical protein n=1 Tax=Frankia sp. AiPa1 TaxID=573492 RepID=UPI00202ADFFD
FVFCFIGAGGGGVVGRGGGGVLGGGGGGGGGGGPPPTRTIGTVRGVGLAAVGTSVGSRD